jgi:hypothetical protein
MSRILRLPARVRRRLLLAVELAHARHELRRRGLRVPSGCWFCEPCQEVMWDRRRFDTHARAHAL